MNTKILKGCSENFTKFFDWTTDYLLDHGKKAVIVNKRNIDFAGSKCSGWCDGEEIVAARKNPLFEQVYCHEFSHMTQAVEKSPLWKDEYDFWDLFEKDQISPRAWDSIMEIIALEYDCEKRSLAFSKQWNLFDNEKYAQQANLYLFYYQYVFLKRQWIDSTSIYHPLILDQMPKKLVNLGEFNSINMKLMSLFDECLDKNGKFYTKGFTWNKLRL